MKTTKTFVTLVVDPATTQTQYLPDTIHRPYRLSEHPRFQELSSGCGNIVLLKRARL